MSKKINISDCSECFSEEVLLQYVNDKLSPEESTAVEKHISKCEMCSDVVDGLLLMESTDDFYINKDSLNKEIDARINSFQNKKSSPFTLYRSIAAVAVLVILSGSYFLINYLVKDKNIQDVNKSLDLSQAEKSQESNQQNQITELPDKEKEETKVAPKNLLDEKFVMIPEMVEFDALEIVEDKINLATGASTTEQKEEGITYDSEEIAENLVGDETLDYFKNHIDFDDKGEATGSGVDASTLSAVKTVQGGIFSETIALTKPGLFEKSDRKEENKLTRNSVKSEQEKTENGAAMDTPIISIVEDFSVVEEIIMVDADVDNAEVEIQPIDFAMVETKPEFPGGDAALMKYISENTSYPTTAKENGISGKVFVGFIIDKEGYVKQVTVFRGVDEYLDKEAMRVVESMPRWTPGKQRGFPVEVRYIVPISFSLF